MSHQMWDDDLIVRKLWYSLQKLLGLVGLIDVGSVPGQLLSSFGFKPSGMHSLRHRDTSKLLFKKQTDLACIMNALTWCLVG